MCYNTGLKKILPYLLLIPILLLAGWARQYTFWQPHWQGDQSQNVILAMKLNERGIRGYNLSEVRVHVLGLENESQWYLSYADLDRGKAGDLARAYKMFDLDFYTSLPLFYKAPLFPAALSLSHQLFAPPGLPYVVVYL